MSKLPLLVAVTTALAGGYSNIPMARDPKVDLDKMIDRVKREAQSPGLAIEYRISGSSVLRMLKASVALGDITVGEACTMWSEVEACLL